jgi:hypothetical protein
MLFGGILLQYIILILSGDAPLCELPCGHELLEEFIAVTTEISHIVDGYVQEPYHDIVSLLVDEQTDVDPVAHHGHAYHCRSSTQHPQQCQVEGSRARVVEEGGKYGRDVVGEDGGGCEPPSNCSLVTN